MDGKRYGNGILYHRAVEESSTSRQPMFRERAKVSPAKPRVGSFASSTHPPGRLTAVRILVAMSGHLSRFAYEFIGLLNLDKSPVGSLDEVIGQILGETVHVTLFDQGPVSFFYLRVGIGFLAIQDLVRSAEVALVVSRCPGVIGIGLSVVVSLFFLFLLLLQPARDASTFVEGFRMRQSTAFDASAFFRAVLSLSSHILFQNLE
jgi:hypothetical protein